MVNSVQATEVITVTAQKLGCAGLNAIEDLVFFNVDFVFDIAKQKDMLRFLINNGVSIEPSPLTGLDALNYAFMKAQNTETALHYVQFLVQLGAVIRPSHFKQVRELKKSNQQRYDKLVQIMPEFDANIE